MRKTHLEFHKLGKIIAYLIPVLLILIVFFSNRSLLLDSLNLARNIAEGSFLSLTAPLKYEQSAPLVFLYITKIITLLLGISEYTLRLLPMLSGIFCLFFFGSVLNRILHVKYVLLGIVWLGTNAMYVRYATEFKQYITDALVCTFLIWLALKFKKLTNRNILLIGLFGAISIWLSMPSIFVLLGLILYYLHIHYKAQNNLISIVILAAWFIINFTLEYFLILNPAIQSDHMQNFHQNYILHGTFWKLDSLQHDLGLIVSTVRIAVGKSGLAIAVALILITFSLYDFIKNKRSLGILIVIPLIAVLGASILGKYSMIERLMLFSLPLLIILILMGAQILVEKLSDINSWFRNSIIGILGIAFAAGYTQTQGLKYIFEPLEIEDNRTSLLHINQHEKHANSIVCSQFAFPAYAYYTNYDSNSIKLHLGNAIAAKYDDSVVELAIKQNKKDNVDVWILLGHMPELEITALISDLEKLGTIKNSYRTKRSAAILFSTH